MKTTKQANTHCGMNYNITKDSQVAHHVSTTLAATTKHAFMNETHISDAAAKGHIAKCQQTQLRRSLYVVALLHVYHSDI